MLRRALRAKARQLGGGSQADGLTQLLEEIAYEQWHRMLFARFLAENDLLIHPAGVAVTLDRSAPSWPRTRVSRCLGARRALRRSRCCPASSAGRPAAPGAPGAAKAGTSWSRSSAILPARRLHRRRRPGLGLPVLADARRRTRSTQSRRKIGGDELPAVTQLFTEDYMVRFLLENSLGAWWAARHPDSPLLKDFALPALQGRRHTRCAGSFPGWPEQRRRR